MTDETTTMSETPDTTTETNSAIDHTDLSAFEQNLLVAAAGVERDAEEVYGLAIKERVDSLYDERINHGRLYQNLDNLVEKGLLEKGEIDQRTNSYHVTDEGERVLRERRDQIEEAFGGELSA